MTRAGQRRVSIVEALGLAPFSRTLPGISLAVMGDRSVPPSRVGLSSLRLLRPRLALLLWTGRLPVPHKAVLINLFNRRQTPACLGWSVRRTRAVDFRGRALTYDSHNGTDFAVPPGTRVAAAASGRVALILFEFNRGGLKLVIDHGEGWFTSYNHLSRALRSPGEAVLRGEPVALSGMSGIDGVLFFPWNAPHLHFNVLQGAAPVDPFAAAGEVSLWQRGNSPAPPEAEAEPVPEQSRFIQSSLKAAMSACRSERRRAELARIPAGLRAPALLLDVATYPTRYPGVDPSSLVETSARRPFLSLPLAPEAVDGVVYAKTMRGGTAPPPAVDPTQRRTRAMLSRIEMEKALRRWNDAWANHDLDGVMALFHDDVVFENWTGARAEGKDALRKAWAPWFASHGGFRFVEEETFIDESQQKVLYRWQLHWPSFEKGFEGKPEKRSGVDVIHFEDGRIIRKLSYSKTTIEIDGSRVSLRPGR